MPPTTACLYIALPFSRVVNHVIARYSLLTLLVAATAARPLAAQLPHRGTEVPVVPGSAPDTAAERAHLAALRDSGAAAPRWFRMYVNEAGAEVLFDWYRNHLNAKPGAGSPDSVPDLPEDGATAPAYWITFHDLTDKCADPPPPPGPGDSTRAGTTPCKHWLLGKDKKNALGMSRIRYRRDDKWIEEALFRWYVREGSGDVLRLQVELKDTGLTSNWKYYAPRAEIIVSTVPIGAPVH